MTGPSASPDWASISGALHFRPDCTSRLLRWCKLHLALITTTNTTMPRKQGGHGSSPGHSHCTASSPPAPPSPARPRPCKPYSLVVYHVALLCLDDLCYLPNPAWSNSIVQQSAAAICMLLEAQTSGCSPIYRAGGAATLSPMVLNCLPWADRPAASRQYI